MSNVNQDEIHVLNPINSLLDGISHHYRLRIPSLPPTRPFLQTQASTHRPKKRRKVGQGLDQASENWNLKCLSELDLSNSKTSTNSGIPPWWDERVGERVRFGDKVGKQSQFKTSDGPHLDDGSKRETSQKSSLQSIWARETNARLVVELESRKIRSRFGATNDGEELQPIYLPFQSPENGNPLDLGSQLVHHPITNVTNQERILDVSIPQENRLRLLLPPRSIFLLTDLLNQDQNLLPIGFQETLSLFDHSKPHHVQSFHFDRKGFDLILLDPPFPNHSASRLSQQKSKRSCHSYSTVDDLYDLWPLKTSLNHALEIGGKDRGTLVGCWVTNSPKCRKFILEKLFPSCNLEFLTELKWLKITCPENDDQGFSKGGQPIFSLDSSDGRKPFEVLLLARYCPSKQKMNQVSSDQTPTSDLDKDRLSQEVESPNWKYDDQIPGLTVISVPLGHSRKPDVVDVLRPYLPYQEPELDSPGPNVLELFSRRASAGPRQKIESEEKRGWYVSVGNESCAFNEVNGKDSNGYFSL